VVRFGEGPLAPIVTPDFAALSPGFAGLYQINVRVPVDAEKGTIPVTIAFPDGASNSVLIAVQ